MLMFFMPHTHGGEIERARGSESEIRREKGEGERRRGREGVGEKKIKGGGGE